MTKPAHVFTLDHALTMRKINYMFSKIKDESFDTGSQWGMDTFAWTVEMLMLKGMNLEEAYKLVKDTYTNKDSLNSRLEAWKELNV